MKKLHNTDNAFLVIEIINQEKKVVPFFSSNSASIEYHRCVNKIKLLGQSLSSQKLAVYFVPLLVNNNISMIEFVKNVEDNIEQYIKRPLISYVFKGN